MKEYQRSTLSEFQEFFQVARSLMPTSMYGPESSASCPSIEKYKISTDYLRPFDKAPSFKFGAKISKIIIADLKSHVVFLHIFKNVYFQKALKKFESHRYYRNNSESGLDEETFQDCIVLFLMSHAVATIIAYDEYHEPVFEGMTNKEKKKWNKQIEDFEKLSEEKRLNLSDQWKGTFEILMSTLKKRISSEKKGSQLPSSNKRAVKLRQKAALRLLLNVYLVEYGGFCKIVLKNIAKAVLPEESECSIEGWVDEIQKDIEHCSPSLR